MLLSVSVWDGGGTSDRWSEAANWLGDVVPSAGDDLVFRSAGSTTTENDLPDGTSFRSLTFRRGDFSIEGNSLAITNRILVGPHVATATIVADVSLSGAVGVKIIGGPLNLAGAVSGSGSLIEKGNGILVLSGGASFTGPTTIRDGATLRLGCTDALPSDASAGAVRVNGTLDLAGYSSLLHDLSGGGLVTSSQPGSVTLSVDNSDLSTTFSGVIEDGLGRVALRTVGTGTLTLTGENTFTGETIVDAGSTLQLGGEHALPADPEVNGTLDLAGYSATLDGLWGSGLVTSSVPGAVTLTVDTTNYPGTFSGVIEDGSGTLNLVKTGAGTLVLSGTNTYSAGTTISGGTIQVGNYGATGTLGSGSVANNSALVFRRSGTPTFANAISGSGTLTQSYGTLVLTGNNTYSGTTTISSGTLQIGSGGTTGTLGTGNVANNSSLIFNRSDSLTVAASISGYGSVTQQGSGAVTLAGNNTYYGTTTINVGTTLKAGSTSPAGSGTVAINGTLDLNGSNPSINGVSGSGTITTGVAGTSTLSIASSYSPSTFSGVIQDGSGTVALTKTGSGTLTLTGNSTYSGGTTISAGTLQVGSYGSSGSLGSGAVTNSGALEFRRYGTTTVPNAISGTGTLTQWSGTLVLTGTNTYSGLTTVYYGTTLQVGNGGTSGTLGSGSVTNNSALVFNRSDAVTVTAAIGGSGTLTQQGTGAVILAGNNTYSGTTTINAGTTLRVGNGAAAGRLGSGSVAVGLGGSLVVDRSDTLTLGNTITGQGGLAQAGSGTLVLTGQSSLSRATISDGTLQVEGSLTLTDQTTPLTNEATLLVKGTGVVDRGGTRITGRAKAVSAGEVSLASTGMGSDFTYDISTDGQSYYPIADGGAADRQAMLSGLWPSTDYYLRARAAHLDGSQEIYDGGYVTTAAAPAADTAGWYRITSIVCDENGIICPSSYEYFHHAGDRWEPQSASTAYAEPRLLSQSTAEALLPRDPVVLVIGDSNPAPVGSDGVFNLDRSWFFAESPEGAALHAVSGLVYDGTVPKVQNGQVKVWHIYFLNYGQLVCDFWTFDADLYDRNHYPAGGYGDVYAEVPCTIGIDRLDPNCPCECPTGCDAGGPFGGPPSGNDAGGNCGTPSDTGGSMMLAPRVTSAGGEPACGGGLGGDSAGPVIYARTEAGLTYASRETTSDTGFGPGWSDADELPYLMGGPRNVVARFGAEQTVWFDRETDGSYTARYGAKDTLVHDAVNDRFVLTRLDGSRVEFFDYDQIARPQGGLYRWIDAGGATIEVTAWSETGIDGRITEVLDRVTPAAQAHQKRTFSYTTTDDGLEHVQTLTLSQYTGSAWANVRKLTYTYYGSGASYGLPGDLKTILTQHWDAGTSDWAGDDTHYFRYYTSDDPASGAVKHGLKRVLIPNAYAAFVAAYGDPDDPQNENAGDGQTDPIAGYTCFYYEYNADRRVKDRVVFGKSNATDYAVTLSRHSRQANAWDRKTVETRLDGSTYTVYANFLGQPILTDLYDPAAEAHTLSYNRYDAAGRKLFSAEPSAFTLYGGAYYDEDYADLVNYAGGDSPYLSNTAGLFELTTYYASTTPGIDEDTAGGVAGYAYQTAVAHGETAARTTIGQTGGPVLLSSTSYFARTVGGATIYPAASRTVYANDDGTGAITTSYAYTWHSGTLQVQEETTTLPAVPTGQNGSGTSATRKQWFNDRGQLAWTLDELGRAAYYGYDSLTGRLALVIQDIDDGRADELQLTIPTGWTLPATGGANLATEYEHDALGRVTRTLGPAHTADVAGTPTSVRTANWTFYNDAAHETRSAQGYALAASPYTETIVGPISVQKTDRDGRVTSRIQAVYTGDLEDLATATIAQTDYTAWTAYRYANTRMSATAVYDDIPSSTSDPDSDGFIGTSGVNYEKTTLGYETFGTAQKGRQNRTVAPDGTITRVVYDARGNVVSTWIGTDDTGATDADPTGGAAQGNNMLKVASSAFDTEGNLTESRAYFGSGASDHYATEYQYDWRDRPTDVLSPADVVTHTEYDNLGRALWTKTYASADFTLAAGELRDQTDVLYDPLGRVYESRVYEVDPDDGTVGDYLPGKIWYDARGQVIKTATGSGLFQKYAYDGLGRIVATYSSFDTDETAYADAHDVAGDTVIEQTQTWYDQAGQTVATAGYQRLPDDTSTTGALSATNSYATAAVVWYDGLGRTATTANYGREDVGSGLTHYFFDGTTGALVDSNSSGIPDVAEAAPPAPNSSDNYIVGLTQYDSAGRAYRSIDNLGRINETQFDDAGRTVRTIQNYDDGSVAETDTDQDVTVEYQYDSGGRLVTLTAYNAKGSGNGVQTQATKYLYASAINASWQTGAVYPDSTDVLSQDSTTKVWTITTDNGDHVSTSYDRLGRKTSTTDQRGVVHEFTFDSAGRLAADTVTSLGSTGLVDGSVRRIGRTYDDLDRVRTITSYSDTSGTTAVNEVKYEYNGWGKVAREYQEHDGAVDGSTPFVQYNYEDSATGGAAKYVRLAQVTYAGGRDIHYGYGSTGAIDDIMSRLATIGDGTNNYAAYKYLGAGRIVGEDYEDVEVKHDYSANDFTALDRFGRVLDQVWTDYGGDPDLVIDHYSYTYDRAGNRTSRDNELHSAFDEDYTYDSIDRLTNADRADSFDQSWALDGLGNFSGFDDDGSSQTRTANAVNEITAITGGWISPSYDAAGNLISGPKPRSETTRVHYVYDAWNRLVAVKADDSGNPGDTLAEYEYDGTNRRVEKETSQADGGPTHAHYFHNQAWQMLEERFVDGQGGTVAVNQYVWSARYIDAPIMRFHDGNGDGDLLDAGDNVRYYTGDANFNVTATLDAATGNVVERYVYTAYGEATVYSPTWTNPAAPAADGPLYCGYFFDAETALYYVRNRYYDASLSIFISRDPIEAESNLYLYVSNHPVVWTDPTGLVPTNPDPGARGECEGVRPNPAVPSPNRPTPPPIPPAPNIPPGPGWIWKPVGTPPGGPNGAWEGPDGDSLKPHLDHKPPKPPHWDWTDKWGNKWEWDPSTGKWSPKPGNNPNKPQPVFPPGTFHTACACTCVCIGGYLTYRCIRMIPSLIPPAWPTIIPNLACP